MSTGSYINKVIIYNIRYDTEPNGAGKQYSNLILSFRELGINYSRGGGLKFWAELIMQKHVKNKPHCMFCQSVIAAAWT